MSRPTPPPRTARRAAVLALLACLPLAACADVPSSTASLPDPVTVEAVGGTDLKRLTLTEKAAGRLGVTTAPVTAEGDRLLMPYAALLYLPDGTTFAYTNPDGRSYVRAGVTVEGIRGDQAVLTAGPPPGTAVVTIGGAELWGAEFGIK